MRNIMTRDTRHNNFYYFIGLSIILGTVLLLLLTFITSVVLGITSAYNFFGLMLDGWDAELSHSEVIIDSFRVAFVEKTFTVLLPPALGCILFGYFTSKLWNFAKNIRKPGQKLLVLFGNSLKESIRIAVRRVTRYIDVKVKKMKFERSIRKK